MLGVLFGQKWEFWANVGILGKSGLWAIKSFSPLRLWYYFNILHFSETRKNLKQSL